MGSNLNLAWSPDGRLIAMSNEYEYIGIVDVVAGAFVGKMKHVNQVRCFAWSANSDYLLVGTGSMNTDGAGYLEVFSVVNGDIALVKCLNAHTSYCAELRIDPTYSYIAIAAADYLVSLWDLNELICFQTLHKFDEEVRGISFSPSGSHIAVATVSGGHVYVFKTKTGEQVHAVECKSGAGALAWNPVHSILAIASTERDEGDQQARFRDKTRDATVTLLSFD
jgi:WD40 repeat protein